MKANQTSEMEKGAKKQSRLKNEWKEEKESRMVQEEAICEVSWPTERAGEGERKKNNF